MKTFGVCLGLLLLAAAPTLAQSRTVTFSNQSSGSVREIHIDAAEARASAGNRLRNSLPPNARASITYSQGCRANVRIVLDAGAAQEHRDTDVCVQPNFVVTGRGAASAAPRQEPGAVKAGTSHGQGAAAPPEAVPWTGRSITKKLTLDGYR